LDAAQRLSAPPNQEQGNSRDHAIAPSALMLESLVSHGQSADANEFSLEDDPGQPKPIPYEEYAAMTQKVNQYRQRIIQGNEKIVKLNDNVRRYRRANVAWKEYAEKVYAKLKERTSSDHEATSGSRKSTPGSDILPPSLMVKSGRIPTIISSSATKWMGVSPSISPKANSPPPSTLSTVQASAADGNKSLSKECEIHPHPASEPLEALQLPAANDSPKPIQIKNEPLSSPIARSPPKRPLKRVSTLDLDDVDNTTTTPHRRRRVEAWIQSRRTVTRKHELEDAKPERSSSLPLEDQPSLEYQGEAAPLQRKPLPAFDRADTDPNMKVEDALYDEIVSSRLARGEASVTTPSNQSNVLRLMDSNKRMLPRTDEGIDVKRRKRNADTGADKIALITEEGDDYKRKALVSGSSVGAVSGRLTKLLNESTPAKHRLSTLGLPTATSLKRSPHFKTTDFASPIDAKEGCTMTEGCKKRSLSRAGEIHKKSTTPVSASQPKDKRETSVSCKNTSFGRMSGLGARSKRQSAISTPLRCRPLSELRISDFKINPRANQGYDYAYIESLRSREQPHEARPSRVMNQTRNSELQLTLSMPPLLTSEIPYGVAEADARILKEYMGNAYNAESISNMPPAQQQDLVAQARTELTAEWLERHRVQFQRHQTPPGFWNMDMSSTQNLEEDRKEAERLERISVANRWREAMRDGGQWLFRDEN